MPLKHIWMATVALVICPWISIFSCTCFGDPFKIEEHIALPAPCTGHLQNLDLQSSKQLWFGWVWCVQPVPSCAEETEVSRKNIWICLYITTSPARILQTAVIKNNTSDTAATQTRLPAVGKSELRRDPEHPEEIWEEFLSLDSFSAQEKEISLPEGWQTPRVNTCQQNNHNPQVPASVSWPGASWRKIHNWNVGFCVLGWTWWP